MAYQNGLFPDEELDTVEVVESAEEAKANECVAPASVAPKNAEATLEEIRHAFDYNLPINADMLFTPIYNSNGVNFFSYLSKTVLTAMKSKNNKGKYVVIRHENDKMKLDYRIRKEIIDIITIDGRSAQFLWFLIAKYALLKKQLKKFNVKDADNSTIIVFRQSEVAKVFGITPRYARTVVQDGFSELNLIEWKFDESLPNAEVRTWHFRPVDTMVETKRYGYVGIRLNVDFVNYLNHTYIEYFPVGIMRIVPKRNPNSLSFAIKLVSNYNINKRNGNEEQAKKVSVKVLLGIASNLPKKEAVEKIHARLNDRIIRPFVRDMDNLKELNIISDWYFIWPNSGGRVVQDYKKIIYDDFEKMVVFYLIPQHSPEI